MWSIAVYSWRLTSEQFWRLTWAQFEALGKRHDEANRRTDYSFAIVASATMNAGGAKKKGSNKPFSPEDFLPRYHNGPERGLTVEQFRAKIELELMPQLNRRFDGG